MNHHERVLAALNHQEPDRVPRYATLDREVVEEFRRRTGWESPAEYWDWDIRGVAFMPPDPLPDLRSRFGRYHDGHDVEWVLDWEHRVFSPELGVATRLAHFHDLAAPLPPMTDLASVKELEEYPLPDYVGEWRHEHLEEDIQVLKDQGYAVQAHIGWILQTCWTFAPRPSSLPISMGIPNSPTTCSHESPRYAPPRRCVTPGPGWT